MKRVLLIICAVLMLAGCGVGTYSLSSGKADECYISFTALNKKQVADVTIDGKTYELTCVYEKAYRNDRNIKKTTQNTVVLQPGTHEVSVSLKGEKIYTKTLFISAQEHKVVNL